MRKPGYDDFFKKLKDTKTNTAGDVPRVAAAEEQIKRAIQKRKIELQRKSRKKRDFPASIVFGMVLITGLLALALFTPKKIEDYLSSVEIQFFGHAIAADPANSAKNSSASTTDPAKKTIETAGPTGGAVTESDAVSAEDMSHFKKLVERKRELDQRETELGQLEEELQQREREIEARIQQLEGVKREIASILKERVQLDDAKVTKLVEFYSNMKPKQAAEILGTVNEDLAVEVLGRMKKKDAAEIMNLLKAEKAQTLTEKLAGYRR